MEVKLPSGRIVQVSKYGVNKILVEFEEGGVRHKLVFKKGITKQELDEEIDRYLYGYDDPETGEHVMGYFELIKQRQNEEEEELVR